MMLPGQRSLPWRETLTVGDPLGTRQIAGSEGPLLPMRIEDQIAPSAYFVWLETGFSTMHAVDFRRGSSPFSRTSASTQKMERVLGTLRLLGVNIPQINKVRDYFFRHQELENLPSKAAALAVELFGGNANLVLDVYEDQEAGDESLLMLVRLPKYDSSVMRKIHDLREKIELPTSTDGYFFVTTDFRLPE